MAEFRGSALYFKFVFATGTFLPQVQYRTCSVSDEIELIDSSAGTVAAREYITGLRTSGVEFVGLHNNTDTPAGNADINALVPGLFGTVEIAPSGTATSNQKITIPAYIKSRPIEFSYEDVSGFTISFQGSGLAVYQTY